MTHDEPRHGTDWERIEVDYRAGLLTLREIAAQHGITHAAVQKRAKRGNWGRDLAAKVRARAAVLVAKATVAKTVTAERLATERETIEVAASAIVEIKLGHQGSSRRGVDLGVRLMSELEAQAADVSALERLGEMMASPDERGKDALADAYRKATSLAGRASTYKTLIDGLRIAVALQRQAFDMDAEAAGDAPLADRLKALSASPDVPQHAAMPDGGD